MNTAFWAKVHGAATHFPIALMLCSGVLDVTGFSIHTQPSAANLRAAGYWTMLLAATGSVPAVASGLLMTNGSLIGHGALRLHHQFVWPAFGLLIGLATWRLLVERCVTRPMFAGYLVGMSLAGGLMAAASYWGGEMMIAR